MKSKNTALIETARALAYEHAMGQGYSWRQWELASSKRRTREASRVRHELMQFLDRRGFPLTIIGAVFNRDHSSVFDAVKWMPLPPPNLSTGYHESEVGALR